MRLALALAVFLAAGSTGWAKGAPPPKKYYLELAEVETARNAPADLGMKTRTVFADIVRARPEVLGTLEGAPDAKTHPQELRRWLDDRNIRAFSVRLKVEPFERSLAPNDKPGHSGQILTIKLGVSMVGAQIPGEALALAGDGGSTVMAEVGPTLRPREEEATLDDALKDALGHALADAITKLSAPPPKVVKKRR